MMPSRPLQACKRSSPHPLLERNVEPFKWSGLLSISYFTSCMPRLKGCLNAYSYSAYSMWHILSIACAMISTLDNVTHCIYPARAQHSCKQHDAAHLMSSPLISTPSTAKISPYPNSSTSPTSSSKALISCRLPCRMQFTCSP